MTHPITPPDELVRQWRLQWLCANPDQPCGLSGVQLYIAAQASQWGWEQRGAATEAELQQRADQELDACCEWMLERGLHPEYWRDLRTARRPKPPSLKEQALLALREAEESGHLYVNGRSDLIRHALEQLND